MAIRDWHPGQLVVLWVGGLFTEWVIWGLGSSGELPSMFLAVFIGLPFALLAVTWIWFGGRRQ